MKRIGEKKKEVYKIAENNLFLGWFLVETQRGRFLLLFVCTSDFTYII